MNYIIVEKYWIVLSILLEIIGYIKVVYIKFFFIIDFILVGKFLKSYNIEFLRIWKVLKVLKWFFVLYLSSLFVDFFFNVK